MDTNVTTDDSALRFANIEIGDATATVGSSVNTLPVVETSANLPTATTPERIIVPGVTVDHLNVKRCLADQAAAQRGGFSLPPPIYQIGRSVNELGVGNFKASRDNWDSKAMPGEACAKLINQVNSENRKDVVVDVPTLHMRPDGMLMVDGVPYQMTRRAIEGIAFHSTPTGAKYLAECPADLRARNFNHWFDLAFTPDKRAANKAAKTGVQDPAYVETETTDVQEEQLEDFFKSKRVTLRMRDAKDGGREIYSAVGPNYAVYDFNLVVERIYQFLADKNIDARCDITYDGYKARMDVLFHTDIKPEHAAAGEIFKAGLLIKTADDGTGAIEVMVELHRNLCLNLIILASDKILVGRKTHKGKKETIESKLAEVLDGVDEKIGYFMKAWSSGNVENILERYDLSNARDVFSNLALNKVIKVPGLDNDEVASRLFKAWEMEPGHTKTAFLNAITRMAHSETWESMDTVEELETTAGNLLFAKQWDCLPPKEKTVAEVLGGF